MSINLRCVVVSPLDKEQSFTFPPEENPELWKAMRNMEIGTARALKGALNITVVPMEEKIPGYDAAATREAHEHLTEAFRGVTEILVTRDKYVAILSGLPRTHPGIVELIGPPEAETDPAPETAVIPTASAETAVIPAPDAKPKTFAEKLAEDLRRKREGGTSATEAKDHLDSLYKRR